MLNAHLIELICDRLCVSVMIEEGIGDDKRLFLVHDVLQLVKRYGQAALLDVDLFGGAEPEHIFSPLGYCFYIQKVLYADILRNAVAAPRAAAEGQRGRELEVIEIADAALRRGGVDEYAAGLHSLGKFGELSLLGLGIEVYRRGVTVAAVGDEVLCLREGVLYVLCTVHGKDR